MKLEELIVCLRIEEDNYKFEKKIGVFNSMESKANIVESGTNTNKKMKHNDEGPNQGSKIFKGKCYNCGKLGHISKDCRKPKNFKKLNTQANMIGSDKLSIEINDINLSTVVLECNLVGNPNGW